MAIDKIFNDANVDGIADNIFGAVNNSVSEVKAMQQRKAAENVQMVVEAFKKIETNITEKFDNVTDVIEKRVLTIKDGRDGSSGSDGRNGRDGKPGRDGVNGKQGPPGTPGKDGVDGEDGVSVTNANIDFDGSLVISLSSGQQINVGEVVAPDLAEKIKIVSTMSTNGAVGIKDEGTSITPGVKTINFVGATVTATNSGDDVTVNVSAGTGTVTSVAISGGTTGLTTSGGPITTSGTVTLAGTLAVANGGTNITSYAVGDVLFASTTGVLSKLADVATGNALISGGVNTAPSYGKIALTTHVSGTLPVANGGTGLTSGTSGGVLAYTASGTLASSSALAASALVIGGGAGAAPSTTTTGTGVVTALGVNTGTAGAFVVNGGALGTPSSGTVTNLTGTASININGTVGATTPGTGAFTTLTTSSTVTHSGGTANGVAYLNGSKVLTTGSALVFDGSNLGLGVTPSAWSSTTALQVGLVGGAISSASTQISLSYNWVATSTGNKYITNGFSSIYQQNAGAHAWYTAPSGTAGDPITFTQAMTLDSSGNLGIGTTSPSTRLHLKGASGTTTLRLEPSSSTSIYTQVRGANGDLYLEADPGNAEGSSSMLFTVDATERARIDSSGNLLVGITSAVSGGGVLQVSNGITFPATQSASSDANTLDDYEEGSHTTTANANTTLDNSYRAFKYTKVGNVVNVVGLLQITGSTGSTTLTFTLPFTAAADQTNGQNRSVGGCLPGNATTGTGGMVPFVQNNTAIMNLYKITLGVATNSTYAAATNADVINGSSINFNITYLTT